MQTLVLFSSYWHQSLPVVGAFFLLASTSLVGKIIGEVYKDSERSKWVGINGLIVFFFLAYILYAVLESVGANTHAEYLVPVILVAGSVFVYLVCRISYTTALSLKRIATLEIENVTDSLTGVFNRRYLDRRLNEECLLGKRHKYDSAVIMLDVDHFKRVNDTYGHHAGDAVLKQIGLLLNDNLRKTDVIVRYGGEEFLVLLPRTSSCSALIVADNIRQLVEQTHHQVVADRSGLQAEVKVTVSMGVACFSSLPAEVSPDVMCSMVVDCADHALYKAKSAGRNRVVVWTNTIDAPTLTHTGSAKGAGVEPSVCEGGVYSQITGQASA